MDDHNPIFIDWDPEIFFVLLSLLQSNHLPSTTRRFSKQELADEALYYGIESHLKSTISPPPFKGIDASLISTIVPMADGLPSAFTAGAGDGSVWIAHEIVNLQVLRYIGVVDVVNRKGVVELRKYKKEHPFAQLLGSDNIIAFTTTRYEDQPLIVRGPGAGAQVTAGGLFNDILRLASYLGAPS